MELYFRNSHGVMRKLYEADTYKELTEHMNEFMDSHKFKSYYTRIQYDPDKKMYQHDVGSHTEFFYTTDVPEEMKVRLYPS